MEEAKEKVPDNDKDNKIFDCSKFKNVSNYLAAIGVAVAVIATLNKHTMSQLNIDYLIPDFLSLPALILYIATIFTGFIKIIYNYLKYGELDALENLVITRRFTIENTLQATYLLLVLAFAPLVGYFCGLGAILAVTFFVTLQ